MVKIAVQKSKLNLAKLLRHNPIFKIVGETHTYIGFNTQLKCGFLKKSFIMNTPVITFWWVCCCAPTKK